MNNKVNSVLNSIEKIDHLVMEADVSVSDAMNDVYNKQFKMEGNATEDYINHEYYQEILEEFPDESYKILQRFVKPALDNYLRKRAVELRNSIVQEGNKQTS